MTKADLELHSLSKNFKTFVFCALLTLFAACGKDGGNSRNGVYETVGSHFIINGVNWMDVTTLPPAGIARKNTKAVGNLSIFKEAGFITRCTAFLVTPDIIMTNHHCVSNSLQARGAYIEFRYEKGVAYNKRDRYSCEQFIDANLSLDMALLRCQGRPGLTHGVLQLSGRSHAQFSKGESMYVVHQNCNQETNPSCTPVKILSPGRVTKIPTTYNSQVQFDADTLQGSSGGPVFSSVDHSVIALNNVGLYHFNSTGGMVGESNGGVAITSIVNYLKRKFPTMPLGKMTPKF